MTASELCGLALVALVSFGTSYVGAAVGLVLGQFRVVLLTYVLGSAPSGVATSLAISTVATLVGAIGHARGGRVNVASLVTIGAPSALAAFLVAKYAQRVDARLLKIAIAATLLVTAVRMLRPKPAAPSSAPRAYSSPARALALEMLVGAVLGAICGLIGLLLGSVRLPTMLRLGLAPATAVGTNMAIGALTGLFAALSGLHGGSVDRVAFVVIAPLTLVGAHLGARKTGSLDRATLTRWIGYVLVPTALVMVAEVSLAHAR